MSYPIRESKAPNLYRRCPWKVQRYWNWEDGLVFCTRLAAARITNQLIYTRPISGRHSGALQFSSQDTNTHSAHFRTPSEAPHTDTHPNTAGSQDGEGWMLNRSDIFCSPALLVLFLCVTGRKKYCFRQLIFALCGCVKTCLLILRNLDLRNLRL